MIEKNIFRKQIKSLLLEQMVLGKLNPGSRISLPSIAKELEVSVTPVREALTQLAETGIASYIPNRGFFVTDLTKKEAKDLYDLTLILESEAIKKSSYSAGDLEKLNHINHSFAAAKSPSKRLKLDMQFHQLLTSNYSNQFALKILEDIRVRVAMYEHKFMATQSINDSVDMHQQIIKLLADNKKSAAIKVLRANWQVSIEHIIETYEKSDSEL